MQTHIKSYPIDLVERILIPNNVILNLHLSFSKYIKINVEYFLKMIDRSKRKKEGCGLLVAFVGFVDIPGSANFAELSMRQGDRSNVFWFIFSIKYLNKVVVAKEKPNVMAIFRLRFCAAVANQIW